MSNRHARRKMESDEAQEHRRNIAAGGRYRSGLFFLKKVESNDWARKRRIKKRKTIPVRFQNEILRADIEHIARALLDRGK